MVHSGQLLRIFIDEDDRYGDEAAATKRSRKRQAAGFAGATVLKGAHRGIRFSPPRRSFGMALVDLMDISPIVIEVIESEEKVLAFLPALRAMVSEGLLTLEKVDLIRLQARRRES